jgi:hypothetical protein
LFSTQQGQYSFALYPPFCATVFFVCPISVYVHVCVFLTFVLYPLDHLSRLTHHLSVIAVQGFAPHFDDIEAFILQLEGRKRWRVYSYPEPPPDDDDEGKVDQDDDDDDEGVGGGGGSGGFGDSKASELFGLALSTSAAAAAAAAAASRGANKKKGAKVLSSSSSASSSASAAAATGGSGGGASAWTGETGPLPRYSSADFKPSQLPKHLLDCVLEPGDLLYLPRGYVHQAETVSDDDGGDDDDDAGDAGDGTATPSDDNNHALHVTLSTGQNNSWADFLELLVPQALAAEAEASVGLREGLPPGYLDCTGAANADLLDSEDDEDDGDDEDGDGNDSMVQRRWAVNGCAGHV